jgi:hypothetical protein
MAGQLSISDQSLKGFYNNFASRLHASDILLQHEKSCVYLIDAVGIRLREMLTQVRSHAYKCGNLIPPSGKIEIH